MTERRKRSASSSAYRGRRAQATTRWVIARDAGLCQMRLPGCTTVATTADHIVPVALGGAVWDETNLRAACKHCNSVAGFELFVRIGNAKNKSHEKNVASRNW